MADSLREFEEQLQQEALASTSEEVQFTANEYTVGGALVRKDQDGTVYEFDPEKHAWFPKIDADFIAQYQMSYGCGETSETNTSTQYNDEYWSNPPSDVHSEEYRVWYERYCCHFYPQSASETVTTCSSVDSNNTVALDAYLDSINGSSVNSTTVTTQTTTADAAKPFDDAVDTAAGNAAGKKRKKNKKNDLANPKPAEPPAWFEVEDEKNSNVYVSGLPEDITIEEFKEFMTKVGVIAYDPVYRKPKVKLYANPDGKYKGDGRCCYIKPESVDLALQILDGAEIRGHVISVEHAKFELKGQYDPSKKRRKLTKQEKKRSREKQEKILGWQPEKLADERPRHERVVVIKYAFRPEDFEKDPKQISEISTDFREECKKYGDVRKVTVYDRHPDGVVTVTFRQPEEADVCIAAVHQRWFDGRSLEAESWDGRTKYTVQESQEEMEKRLSKWHSFIEGESTKTEEKTKNKVDTSTKTPADVVATSKSSLNSAVVSEDSAVQDVNKSSREAETV